MFIFIKLLLFIFNQHVFIFIHLFTLSSFLHFLLYIHISIAIFWLKYEKFLSLHVSLFTSNFFLLYLIFILEDFFFFSEHRLLGWLLFVLSTLNMPYHCYWFPLFLLRGQHKQIFLFLIVIYFFSLVYSQDFHLCQYLAVLPDV